MLTIANISSLYAHTHTRWPMYTQFDTISGVSLQRRIRLFPVSIQHVVNYGPAPSLTGHFSVTSKWPYTVQTISPKRKHCPHWFIGRPKGQFSKREECLSDHAAAIIWKSFRIGFTGEPQWWQVYLAQNSPSTAN